MNLMRIIGCDEGENSSGVVVDAREGLTKGKQKFLSIKAMSLDVEMHN